MMKVIIGELDLTFPIFISKDNHRRIYSSGVPIIEEERYWSKYADRLFWKNEHFNVQTAAKKEWIERAVKKAFR